MTKTCQNCNRPLRPRRGPYVEGTYEDAGGYCHTCRRHLREHGEFRDGWMPGNQCGDRLTVPQRAAFVENRLATYAELRGRGMTRRQCARRMDITLNTLQRFLARHHDDPRSDHQYLNTNANPDHERVTQPLDPTPETVKAAALIQRRCEDAALLCDMLGIAS